MFCYSNIGNEINNNGINEKKSMLNLFNKYIIEWNAFAYIFML